MAGRDDGQGCPSRISLPRGARQASPSVGWSLKGRWYPPREPHGRLVHSLDCVPLLPMDTRWTRRRAPEEGALMADALYIIAKAPRVGHVKTRLGRVIGYEAAVMLYQAFLRDLAVRFANTHWECGWY